MEVVISLPFMIYADLYIFQNFTLHVLYGGLKLVLFPVMKEF